MPEDVKYPICDSETIERTAKKGPNVGSTLNYISLAETRLGISIVVF